MGYLPRFIPPNSIVEVTSRTFLGMHLLAPSADGVMEREIYAVLGRAQHLYRVALHAFTYLSNHEHQQLTVRDADQLEDYLRYVHRFVGDVVRKHTGWKGPVFHGRPSVDVILDDAKAVERLKYICSNGVKEGLVATPPEWPGVSAARALLEQRDLVVHWQGRDDRRAARRHEQPLTSLAYHQTYRLRLTPLPCLARLTADDRRAFFRQMFDQITSEARAARAGKPALGVVLLRAVDRFVPHPIERTPQPIVHASSPADGAEFRRGRAAWLDAYTRASSRLASGELATPFPPGALPPRRPFVPWPGGGGPSG